MSTRLRLRTAAWYGDTDLEVECPDHWELSVHRPRTPAPLSDSEIEQALRHPIGQAPIAALAVGRTRPLIVVDDLTRPTPAARVLPAVLRQLKQAGIAAEQVTILVATGTHRAPGHGSVVAKVGADVAASYRLAVHDDRTNIAKLGRTSFGTPVYVNREALASDLLIGIGGVYPQHSTGFGGGSKLALGILGRRSIANLHYKHPSMGGSYEVANDFRHDLDEIAAMIGLRTSVSVHVDADREIVRVVSGDHAHYYPDAVAFAREAFLAPLPDDADVVISNAYPMDVSLTFMRSKGMVPLSHAAPTASRILVSACPEGVGHHGLFPILPSSSRYRYRHMARRVSARPGAVPAKLARRAARGVRLLHNGSRRSAAPAPVRDATAVITPPVWLYAPGTEPGALPINLPGMTALYSWEEILRRVADEQAGRDRIRVAVYPCAPLHVLEPARVPSPPAPLEALD